MTAWGNIFGAHPERDPMHRSQVCILDGNKYASRCREEGEQSWDILRDCMVLRNQRREPLLTSSACANDYETPQVGLRSQTSTSKP